MSDNPQLNDKSAKPAEDYGEKDFNDSCGPIFNDYDISHLSLLNTSVASKAHAQGHNIDLVQQKSSICERTHNGDGGSVQFASQTTESIPAQRPSSAHSKPWAQGKNKKNNHKEKSPLKSVLDNEGGYVGGSVENKTPVDPLSTYVS